MIQTITRKFPAPTEAHITREDPESSTGIVYIPVSEVDRRKADMSGISTMHPLLTIAKCCLKDKYQERSNASQICQSLAELKTTVTYKVSTTETSDSMMEEASVEQAIKEQCGNRPQVATQILCIRDHFNIFACRWKDLNYMKLLREEMWRQLRGCLLLLPLKSTP